MTIELTQSPASALRGLLGDRIHLPGDPGYDAARTPWNFAVDQRPAAVAFPRTAAEVSAVVRAAADSGLRVAPQSTGHNAGPLAARGLDDVVVVRTSEMGTAIADPARGIVRVEGGALWEPAVEAAAAHGKAVLHGSSPDVGIAGYSLGGGIGWYARKLGLATNSLTAVELVLADGSLVRADAHTDAELFWALRGGGGSFGVVTALEFRMYDVETAYAGFLMWDLEQVEPVLRTWAAWAPGAPDEVTTSFRAMRLPPMPDLPEFLSGRELVVIDGAVLGSDELGRELLAELRALRPEMDTFARVPARSLVRLHMDPEGGAPFVSGSAMLESFPDAAVDAFLAEVGPGVETSLLMAELRQLGGALGRPHEGGGVLTHLDASFVTFAGAMAMTPEMGAQGHADAARLGDALAPFANGKEYLNFAENPVDPRAAYADGVWTQLKGIRSAVDPHGVFAANHPVPRLWEDGAPTA
ncbi:FAD-binding oxidoreductase [Nocardioides sp. MAHUQ-72]|uniref:FAD-binding oxidoreductase n=1 Tax=unclassified Nocardioides TaxID=2615069 RepID=UPI00361E6AB4